MQQHIVIPLPAGVSITQARRVAVECEAVVARVTGTMPDATVTDLALSDQERRVIAQALDVAQAASEIFGVVTPERIEVVADLRARVDPDAVRGLTVDTGLHDELSRPQELAADGMASEYGRSRVRHLADGAVVISGMTDDVERRIVCVERDGRERWRS